MMTTFTYTGSTVERRAKQYCSEDISLIEGYAEAKADNFKGWCIHHRLEFLPCLQRWVSKNELIEKGIYFNRPAWELIFMKIGEHTRFHNQDPKWKANNSEAVRNSKKVKETVRKAQEACRKPFEIDGIRFESQRDAARYYGVGQTTVWQWLNGKRKTDHICHYL